MDLLINTQGFDGIPYTWTNKQQGDDGIMERLDMCNQKWLDTNPHAMVTHLPRIASDHAPLVLEEKVIVRPRTRRFQVEHIWFLHLRMKEMINTTWNEGYNPNPELNIILKSYNTTSALQRWYISTFGHIPSLIKEGGGISQHSSYVIQLLCDILEARSRIQWIQEGDMNTNLFHTKAAIHRINYIRQLQTDIVNWVDDPKVIGDLLVNHFQGKYQAPTTTANPETFECVRDNFHNDKWEDFLR